MRTSKKAKDAIAMMEEECEMVEENVVVGGRKVSNMKHFMMRGWQGQPRDLRTATVAGKQQSRPRNLPANTPKSELK